MFTPKSPLISSTECLRRLRLSKDGAVFALPMSMSNRPLHVIFCLFFVSQALAITIDMRDDTKSDPRLVMGEKPLQGAIGDLAFHDRNRDGWLSSSDPVWQDLSLWYDRNKNARIDTGELIKVSYTPLQAISLRQGKAELMIGHKKVYRDITSTSYSRRKKLRLAFRDDAFR